MYMAAGHASVTPKQWRGSHVIILFTVPYFFVYDRQDIALTGTSGGFICNKRVVVRVYNGGYFFSLSPKMSPASKVDLTLIQDGDDLTEK